MTSPVVFAPNPLGLPISVEQLSDVAIPGAFACIGAPVDIGTSHVPGARYGPAAIRHQFADGLRSGGVAGGDGGEDQPLALPPLIDIELGRRYAMDDLAVFDLGDVRHDFGEGNDRFGPRLGSVVRQALEAGLVPITLGGDHSISRFAIGEVLAKFPKVGILHFDAHTDMFPLAEDTDRVFHGNPFTSLVGHPNLAVMLQLGVRDFEAENPGFEEFVDERVRVVSAFQLQTARPEQVFEGLPRDIPYYLTFDIDCMSPELAPETGTPLPGGLSYYQGLALIDYAARTFDFAGADFVEVAGPVDGTNGAASIAFNYLIRFVLGKKQWTPMRGHMTRKKR